MPANESDIPTSAIRSSYWDSFYSSFAAHRPSAFCEYVLANYLSPTDIVVEVGCGNGRDGAAIASSVEGYHGVDVSVAAIEKARELFALADVPPSRFTLKVTDFADVSFDFSAPRAVVYSRFSLHADTEEAQEQLFNHVAAAPIPVLVLIEARTILDELYGQGTKVGKNAFVTDHFRRFIDPKEFQKQVQPRFDIQELEVSRGFARFGTEDPPVLRAALMHTPS